MPRPRFIAIVGGSASGKTQLAYHLAERLGDAVVIPLDAFYRDLSALTPEERAQVDVDHPDAIDWTEVEDVFHSLSEGKATWRPEYRFETQSRTEDGVFVEPAATVIWEGLWLLRHPSLRERWHRSVFVSCPDDLRLERRLRRDSESRGRDAGSTFRRFHQHILPQHARFVEPQVLEASQVIESPWTDPAFAALLVHLGVPSSESVPAASVG